MVFLVSILHLLLCFVLYFVSYYSTICCSINIYFGISIGNHIIIPPLVLCYFHSIIIKSIYTNVNGASNKRGKPNMTNVVVSFVIWFNPVKHVNHPRAIIPLDNHLCANLFRKKQTKQIKKSAVLWMMIQSNSVEWNDGAANDK